MDEASSLPVADPANSRKIRRRRQFTVLTACITIAIALWFLRALENEYTTRVDHPVRFINLPDKMIPMNELPQRISLEVKGLGFSVLRHNWNFSKNPLIVDFRKLSSYRAKRKKGYVESLSMNQYLNEFSTQLKDLKVLAIFPDTLTIRLAFKKTRNIRVLPSLIYESGSLPIPDSLIRVNPESVEAEGPDLVLDTLHYLYTMPVKINRSGTPFSKTMGLTEVHQLVKTKPEKVTVTIVQ